VALFLIKRVIGDASQTEVDGAIFRAKACAYDFPGLHWQHSYWDKSAGITYCIYEAESKEQIVAHSRRASLICDEVSAVSLLSPDQYFGDSSGTPQPAEAAAISPQG
jgi:hypothetical protein